MNSTNPSTFTLPLL